MPRRARLDVPNILQHIMARGIEGRDIFRDTKDHEAFLDRLSDLVAKGNVQLLAWSLMPDHFHLLLRTREMSLSTLMRRLMTGYAVWYNRRHQRKGHLFQNRYKSIVVEEDPYFLELIRYIHLNPVRAKILDTVSQLDRYLYTGHAVIMGNRQFSGQDVEGILSLFGIRKGPARKRYRDFVEEGINQGAREDLQGGGLIRSAGGREQLALRSRDEWEKGDERILGCGDFVQAVLKKDRRPPKNAAVSVSKILEEVCKQWKLTSAQILGRIRSRQISQARREFFLRAQEEAGESLAALARMCGFSHTSVRDALEKARVERERRYQNL
jgi:REP element-mobilizing transposase RayT